MNEIDKLTNEYCQNKDQIESLTKANELLYLKITELMHEIKTGTIIKYTDRGKSIVFVQSNPPHLGDHFQRNLGFMVSSVIKTGISAPGQPVYTFRGRSLKMTVKTLTDCTGCGVVSDGT